MLAGPLHQNGAAWLLGKGVASRCVSLRLVASRCVSLRLVASRCVSFAVIQSPIGTGIKLSGSDRFDGPANANPVVSVRLQYFQAEEDIVSCRFGCDFGK